MILNKKHIYLDPHIWENKNGQLAPPGFPVIRYMLPLLLQTVNHGEMSEKQLVDWLDTNPARIFGLPEELNTYIEVNWHKIIILETSLLVNYFDLIYFLLKYF
jgi:dihydroorotase-like cyclic amidohydrolase